MEKRKCKSSWGWHAHRPPMTLLRTEGTVAYIGGSDTLPAPLSREVVSVAELARTLVEADEDAISYMREMKVPD